MEEELLIYNENFAPYGFRNWRECCNFLHEKVYMIERGTTLIDYKKGHLIIKCPLSGEKLKIMGSAEQVEQVHRWFILRNLYRPYTHSQ